ncbi:MAG: low molecular weight protein-tyrosine-phosphatase [Flavobacteriia bacterium]
MKILMVCLGNICRSPMAEGLLRKKIQEQGLLVSVDSAGTSAHHIGQAPDARMIETAKRNGTVIEDLRARQFTAKDFLDFDRIFVMDEHNLKDVLQLTDQEAYKNKVRLLLSILPSHEISAVPDPYYGNASGFQNVYDLLDMATDAVLKEIIND